MKHALYEFLYTIGLLAYLPKAVWRGRLPHRGWRMRLGWYPPQVRRRLKDSRPIWIHAVSVGEVLAAQPLVRALRRTMPKVPLVLSTVTRSGFAVASQELGADGVLIYFPLDLGGCVRRALDAVHPRCLVLMESELWPTVIRLTKALGIPIAVVNGRISPRAFRRYQRVKPWLGGMLRAINVFLMQSQEDAERILQLGASPQAVRVVGNVKWEASLDKRLSSESSAAHAAQIGLNGRETVIVAGSTHRGEEEALLKVIEPLRTSHGPLRLLIAPRHLERLDEVEALAQRYGLAAVRCSRLPTAGPWDVGLVDTFGKLSHYYALATVVFVGGSLIPHGGQNPLEPASLGKPIVFGPSMHNFAGIARQLVAHQAVRQLSSREELLPALQALLSDRLAAAEMGRRAQELVERSRGTTHRILQTLHPFLNHPELSERR